MGDNLQGVEEGILIPESFQKVGVWEPVTPAKPTPARPEFKRAVDTEKFLQNFDEVVNSKEGVEDGTNSTLTAVELGDHERSVVNGGLFDTDNIEENSGNQNSGAETGETLDIGGRQKSLGVNANSENQCSNGIDCTNSLASHGRVGGITDTVSGSGCGTSQPQNLKKRKRRDIDTDVKRRARLKVKKHRPKIFDVMKPKKVPKCQKKPKSEKKRKDAKKPKSEKKGKKVKRPHTLKSANAPPDSSCITDPQTPEPSAPNRVNSSTDSRRSPSNAEEDVGKAFDSFSKHAIPSCRRALDYDLDVGQGANPIQDFSDKIAVPHLKVYTRQRKSFRKMDFDLNLEVQEFEFCSELMKIVWEVKNFPIMSKKTRMKRQKATSYPSFLETKEHLREMLPTVNQFSAAIMEPKSFRCVLALQPLLLSRKKRSKRLKNVAEAVRGPVCSSSHFLSFAPATESDNGTLPLLGGIQTKCALPCALAFPPRKQSQINLRRHALQISSPDFGSKLNEFVTEKRPLIDLNTTLPGAFEEVLGVDNQSSLITPVESSEVEPQETQIQECFPYEDCFHNGQKSMVHRQGIKHKMMQQTLSIPSVKFGRPQLILKGKEKDVTPNAKSYHPECLIDDLIKKLEHLSISNDCKQIVMCDQTSHGALIPSKGRTRKKKGPEPPKVIPDADYMKTWILLKEDGSERTEENYWKEQKEIFCGRVQMFIRCMHLIQGNRRFSRWKGSVVDSVIGVFLTQNVSDNMSSDAFMRFVARFPKHSETHGRDEVIGFSQESVGDGNEGTRFSQESVGSNIEHSCDPQIEKRTNDQLMQAEKNPEDVVSHFEGATLDCDAFSKYEVSTSTLEEEVLVVNSKRERTISKSQKKEQEIQINWDDLRKEYDTMPKDTTGDTDDSVDWEAVRCASTEDVAETIGKRGMKNVLARIIKKFLNRLVEDHGKIDLEWLRNVPTEKVRDYLLSFERIGLKSLDCVRLLTLHHHAFPVDTNVARIVVRLGWVPLQPLPGIEFHNLNDYPMLASIQEYLWPRLNALNQQTLYELHYQMITFGKVFCTKKNPRCNVCPMSRSCKHFASAQSAQLRLPNPQEKKNQDSERDKGITTPMEKGNQVSDMHIAPLAASHLDDNLPAIHESQNCEPRHESENCEPIIEIPASPEPKSWENLEIDIEDLCRDSEKNAEEELFWDLTVSARESNIASKELVLLAPEAASFSARKLKSMQRLHTEHVVYLLPDDHDLLARFRKRESDDPVKYLLRIWASDETTKIGIEQDDQTVLGTILIPCRTANRGRFALNGTYFQVNEVFADYETSVNPIRVPRKLVWHLPRRLIYCASSGRSIFRDMTLLDIHKCFWNGYICVRSFDSKSREPSALHERFHIKDMKDAGKSGDKKKTESEDNKKKESKGKKGMVSKGRKRQMKFDDSANHSI